MLSPNDLQAIINDISSIYEKVESVCIKRIAKALGSRKDIASVDLWRLQKLNSVNALRNQLLKEVTIESRLAYEEVAREIENALRKSYFADKRVLEALGDNATWEQVKQSPKFQQILKATLVTVTNSLNYTGTNAIEASITQFKQAVNTAYLQVLTGTQTRYDAVAQACKTLGGGGIKVHYGTAINGRPVTCSLDASIKRDIVTTINKASSDFTLENCEELECDLVETSWHYGSRPEHEVWQGKIFSLSGKSTKYPNFYKATRYGEVDGLCGINCRHSFYPYSEDVGRSNQKGKPTAEENRIAYGKEQKQRYYERALRSLKHEQIALNAGGFEEEARQVQVQINKTSIAYKSFLAQNNLTRLTMNERVSGYHAIGTL